MVETHYHHILVTKQAFSGFTNRLICENHRNKNCIVSPGFPEYQAPRFSHADFRPYPMIFSLVRCMGFADATPGVELLSRIRVADF